MPDFTHLHVHTQYSILDGASDIKVLMNKVREYGMKSIAITDHGNMFGVLEFLKASKEIKEKYDYYIKPIIGCEMYVADGSRFEKKGKEDRSGFHLILLAKNYEGYKNLSRLCSFAFKKEAFYYTPRIDKELLAEYHEGLIASSACLGGEIAQYILQNNEEKAEQSLKEYYNIFGEDFYLELMDHGLREQKEVNKKLIEFASRYNIKCIATNDSHFVNAEDAKAHDILVCLNTGRDYDDPNRMRYTGNEYLRSPEEMEKLFAYYPEAIANTNEIVEKIEQYELKHEVILPSFPLPVGYTDEDEYLRYLTYKGAEILYPDMSDDIRNRIDYELLVIKEKGFAGYFLIVSDYINAAKEMNVAVGPGRGSAAGSAVAFCIGITAVDPIKYNLLFERFLNPERPSMPDIDVDFDDDGREKVKNYVVQKYGVDKVASIVTFGTMAARSAIRDVARVLKLPLSEADRLAKMIPGNDPKMTLKKAYAEVPELREAKEKGSPLVQDTLIFAEKLEGSIRHTGVHACGIIIGRNNLMEHLPLSTAKDTDLMVTQYEGEQVEYVGMLKMDFLGLKTLSIISDTIQNIELRHNIKVDIEKIPLDDELTFSLFQKGDTVSIFQFESEGMRSHLRELKPTNIEDLIAMNALYRPGPMDYIPLFINRKKGKEQIEYPHPWLEGILKATYGIMVYQEQIMQAAQVMAGYSLGQADLLRRAMGKKKAEVMEQQKSVFVQGAVKKGVDKEKAEEVFHVMEKFANYGFNRSHAAAYSVIAYQTAYLKAHYPAEFMAAVLTRNLNDIKKITFLMDECKRMGIEVLGPDVNESEMRFIVTKKGIIRFGLGAVKGVGESAVDAIVAERRENGNYKNIFDVAKRVNLRACNKRCFEALAMAGAFDSFPDVHRAQFFYQESNEESNTIDKIIKHGSIIQSKKSQSQHSLFGETEETDIPDPKLPDCEPLSKLDLLNKEREVTGIYISGHPLEDYKVEIENFCNVSLIELEDLKKFKNRELVFAGIITSVAHKTTKTGKPFGTFVLEDYEGSIQISLFSEDYVKFRQYLTKDYSLFIRARVAQRYNQPDQLELKINTISLLSEVLKKFVTQITVHIPLAELTEDLIKKIAVHLKKNSGSSSICFSVHDNVGKLSVELPSRKIKVDSSEFLKAISKIPEIKYKLN
ncbi:MAG TPA: DNA polymerase III subunit alpha [Bacteroidales bacterium]|nr:DNA polymerase III subunit alpha [Bacteroidales bacterium]HPS17172.1 DNA polymerase III subunit alpha [Bacteroidales bacterium]